MEKIQNFKIIFLILSGAFLLGMISWAYLNFQEALNITNPSRVIVLTAEGKTYAKPDLAVINFSVISQGKEAGSVQKENNEKLSKILNLIKNQGISEKDIKTTLYVLDPQYDYQWCLKETEKDIIRTCPPKIVGYIMRQTIEIRIKDFEKIDKIINILTEASVEEISNVTFTIEDLENYKNLARIEALNKIQERAKILSEKTGIRLGKILEITENTSYPPVYTRSMAMEKAGGNNTQVPVSLEPGQEEVNVVVTVKYEIK